ncbi:MAG: DUF2953 domain-containing protein [Oscillospiraceae bacterium]|nr:DUF2953 domain-containing protein [Oscillospiraceae bacterium]MBQ3501554.1 DUF2953 domain-containing protein [Oscillospiraceae bacterium]MBQ4643966.1 DUF2953 domain-containing protein [Oscillospiraceae bacterium]
MIGWLIFFGIIILILGLLMIPVHAVADYKENFSLVIKFLFFFKFTVFPMKEKPEKEEKTEEKPKTAAAEKPKQEKRKMTLEEIIDFTVDCVKKYGPGAKMILRNIRFHRLELYWKVGAEDAAACGIKYGRICAWLSGVLGFFRNLTKIEKPKIRVFPDFICEKDEIYGGADIEFNPLIVLIGALRMAFVFLKDMMQNNSKNKTKAVKPRQNISQKESA